MVPKGWEVKKLQDIVSKTRKITYGIVVPGPREPNGNLMIRAQDYSFGWGNVDNIYRVSNEVHKSYRRSQVRKGDLLLTIVGSIGKTAIVPEHLDGANLTQQTARLSFDEHHTIFFHSVISSPIGKKEIFRYAKSGVQPSLNLSDIAKFKVPVPPLPEQQKIAKILSTWDKAISTTEALIDNSKQQKKSLMQQLLTGKKRFTGFEGKWEDRHLHEVARIISSPVDKKTIEGELPVELCNYTDVYYNTTITNKLNFMKATAKQSEVDKFTLQVGDVIITKDSETPGDIAIPALVSENLNGVVCGYHLAIVRPEKEKVNGSFLNYLFYMQKTRYYFFTLATGATRFGLSIGAINNAHFTFPPIDEQQKISSVLTCADKEIGTLEKQLADLKQEKKSLMQQLLTGKRRVNVDGMEAA
ncbi:MAG: restriction endonuclease subunit S [Thiotrichaceae bacterium]|nr:restriction endonuclease subunit S [Thiotrichaceae bacterium]